MKQTLQSFELDDELTISEISPGFPIITINNSHASARISLYGGQLLDFKPHNQEEPLLWLSEKGLSEKALYSKNKAIRGGIPICWPWFGLLNEDSVLPAHGYARISLWGVHSTQSLSDGSTQVVLKISGTSTGMQQPDLQHYLDCNLSLTITVSNTLSLELQTTNRGLSPIVITEALHSYFKVSDIHKICIEGLEQVNYLDKVNDNMSCIQEGAVKFSGETDRVFVNTQADIHLIDYGFNRKITLSKNNSNSTVVWNPWQEKSQAMGDMSNEAWLKMVCIESANVHSNKIVINPEQSHCLTSVIRVEEIT